MPAEPRHSEKRDCASRFYDLFVSRVNLKTMIRDGINMLNVFLLNKHRKCFHSMLV